MVFLYIRVAYMKSFIQGQPVWRPILFSGVGEAAEEDGEREAVVQLGAERHQDHRILQGPRHRSGTNEDFLRKHPQSFGRQP